MNWLQSYLNIFERKYYYETRRVIVHDKPQNTVYEWIWLLSTVRQRMILNIDYWISIINKPLIAQADQVQPTTTTTTTDDSGDDCDYQRTPRCRIHALDCRIRPGERGGVLHNHSKVLLPSWGCTEPLTEILPVYRWNRSWGLPPPSVPPPPSLIASDPLGWPLQLWFYMLSIKWRLEQEPFPQYQTGALPSSWCPAGLQPPCCDHVAPKRYLRHQPQRYGAGGRALCQSYNFCIELYKKKQTNIILLTWFLLSVIFPCAPSVSILEGSSSAAVFQSHLPIFICLQLVPPSGMHRSPAQRTGVSTRDSAFAAQQVSVFPASAERPSRWLACV